MDIPIKTNKDFEKTLQVLSEKYGEDFDILNGIHESQLNFSDFIDGFIDKNVADVTIDANANASSKDIRSMMNEKGKSLDKLFAFSKIFYELKKMYGLKTAREWLETEYNGGFYLHDAPTSSYMPYCFSGDTKIMTDMGLERLDSLVGENIKVFNKNQEWEDATVRCFGKQPLRTVTFERCGVKETVRVTGNHQWFVKNKSGTQLLTTDELKEGMRIPFNTTKSLETITPSSLGIAHGLYTGSEDEDKYEGGCTPDFFERLPSLKQSPSYLYGWLSGYFAVSGCVDKIDGCILYSDEREELEFAHDILCVLGLPVGTIIPPGNLEHKYALTLDDEFLTDEFFILRRHKKCLDFYRKKKKNRKNSSWMVVSVEDAGVAENVYCAVVPGTESFTLDGNILTHNCYAYDLTKLATKGLFFLSNYNNQPPNHLTTFIDDVIEYISFMSNRSSGAVGTPNILIWTYYFWKKDCETGYYIKDPDYYIRQSFQKLIYRLNQPFMRVDQTAFVNVSIFDRNYLMSLFGGVQYPDGTLVVDCVEELIEHQKIFMEVVSEIRSENMFTFPVKVTAA